MLRRIRPIALAALCIGTLWYLRDPAWVERQTTGLRGWEVGPDGKRFRWSTGHASFFVPADASSIRIPLATRFDTPEDAPMTVTFAIDDRRAGGAVLTDSAWTTVVLTLPPRGYRSFRRVDVRTSVTRADNHGVMIGDVDVVR